MYFSSTKAWKLISDKLKIISVFAPKILTK